MEEALVLHNQTWKVKEALSLGLTCRDESHLAICLEPDNESPDDCDRGEGIMVLLDQSCK